MIEIIYIIIIVIAFYWLMLETNWLRVRLERPPLTMMQLMLGWLGVILALSFGHIVEDGENGKLEVGK